MSHCSHLLELLRSFKLKVSSGDIAFPVDASWFSLDSPLLPAAMKLGSKRRKFMSFIYTPLEFRSVSSPFVPNARCRSFRTYGANV